jgi:hypothetical protein
VKRFLALKKFVDHTPKEQAMAIRTREEKAAEIIRLEILLGTIDQNANYNQYLKILRKIQKLRDSL